ncbi:MAG TPA: hypothetical protein DIU37_05280, partial [Opitutae bacterium]|nr:hypothetical protein [Opitutae bacterium]
ECFEDAHIARLMNEHFIFIKVDREERPDLDQLYMEAVQMITQRAGWPLNAFCLPDGRPFFGGTYFPPEDRNLGIIPWPQLLMRIANHFKENASELEENADNIVRNLQFSNNPPSEGEDTLTKERLLNAAQALCEMHDDAWGGFGEAPKFPPSMMVDFLLSIRATRACDEGDAALATRIDDVVNKTLSIMARGGIFDQVGGGFARYSVDTMWMIPHFEK